jgi:putative PIN family toxin of toxin-antitoxin system
MKVVIDTNVFISGIFWKGQSNKVLNLWREGKITPVVSADMLSEFTRVMNDFKIQLPEDMIKEWVNLILRNSILVEPKEKLAVVKDDPKDDMFIEAAVTGNVEYIISQNKHLLKLKSYKRIRIAKPEEFNKLFL